LFLYLASFCSSHLRPSGLAIQRSAASLVLCKVGCLSDSRRPGIGNRISHSPFLSWCAYAVECMLCSFCLDGTRHRGASCAPTRLMTPRQARVSQKLWQIDLSSFTRDVECPSVGMIFAHSFSERSAMAVRPSLRTQSSGAKSVKQALIVRLRQHANEFGLTKEDGNPNEQGIEDVAKIASWDTRGGAPKTPGSE